MPKMKTPTEARRTRKTQTVLVVTRDAAGKTVKVEYRRVRCNPYTVSR